MKSLIPALAALAFSALCPVAEGQMLVSPLPGQAGYPPPRASHCASAGRALPGKPILELDEDAVAEANEFRQLRVPGSQVRRRVFTLLNELTWQTNLKTASRLAQRRGKPILWIQALGDLRGYT